MDLLQPRKMIFIIYIFNTLLGMWFSSWAIFGINQVAPIFVAKFAWNEQESILWTSIIANISLVGMLIGSLISGPLISKGRRLILLVVNILAIVSTILCLI